MKFEASLVVIQLSIRCTSRPQGINGAMSG
jgi:hypothetical protein